MIKSGVVNSRTPSVVSGKRGTVVRNGEAVRRDENLPAEFDHPLEKNAALKKTLPKKDEA